LKKNLHPLEEIKEEGFGLVFEMGLVPEEKISLRVNEG